MSRLHVGARAPWAVPFVFSTGTLDGTTIDRVLLRIVKPSGAVLDAVDAAPSASALASVTALWVLAADGSSVTEDGAHVSRCYFYSAADALLGWSEPVSFTVDPNPVAFP